MSNAIELVETIKTLSKLQNNADDPVQVLFGTVKSDSPLQIEIDQHGLVTKEFLILSRNVTDHEIQMTVNHQVEKMSGGAKDPSFRAHIHQYKGTKVFKVLNALKAGERVVLLAAQGGQRYIVMDRVAE